MKRNHRRYLEMASAYVDDMLSSHEAETFERHVDRCEECRATVRELQNIRRLVSEHGNVPVPSYFLTRLHAHIKKSTVEVDPWITEARRLLPIFSLVAVLLFFLFLIRTERSTVSPDEYYLGIQTPAEFRILTQKKAFTNDEVFVLAMVQERGEE